MEESGDVGEVTWLELGPALAEPADQARHLHPVSSVMFGMGLRDIGSTATEEDQSGFQSMAPRTSVA
jgi:hypothetical protein